MDLQIFVKIVHHNILFYTTILGLTVILLMCQMGGKLMDLQFIHRQLALIHSGFINKIITVEPVLSRPGIQIVRNGFACEWYATSPYISNVTYQWSSTGSFGSGVGVGGIGANRYGSYFPNQNVNVYLRIHNNCGFSPVGSKSKKMQCSNSN